MKIELKTAFSERKEMENVKRVFPVVSLCRADIDNLDGSHTDIAIDLITDEEMKLIAHEMGDLMMECFWDALDAALCKVISKK